MAGLTLALVFLIPLVIVAIISNARMGPWAIFLAVLAAAGLFLLMQISSR